MRPTTKHAEARRRSCLHKQRNMHCGPGGQLPGVPGAVQRWVGPYFPYLHTRYIDTDFVCQAISMMTTVVAEMSSFPFTPFRTGMLRPSRQQALRLRGQATKQPRRQLRCRRRGRAQASRRTLLRPAPSLRAHPVRLRLTQLHRSIRAVHHLDPVCTWCC